MSDADSLHVLDSIAQIPPALWADTSTPFMQRDYSLALEQSGAIGERAGWYGQHLVLHRAGQPIAAMPIYLKTHNRGEYVFDHAWAEAYARHGLDYYPRLVTSVPFTPVTGSRILLAVGVTVAEVFPALLQGVKALAQQYGASSWHGLFFEESVVEQISATSKLAQRCNVQFLWQNHDYTDFSDFLTRLTAKRRKSIRVERDKVAAQGISCRWLQGAEIAPETFAFFYRCYQNTYRVRGQKPYLTLAFFEQLGATMAESLALCIADDGDGQPLAAALFFQDNETLYGRYWGALRDVDCLHFEVCYYQGIAYAIAQGLRFFDPGTQGEHKLIRGFAPVYTHSLHWLAEPAFMDAVTDFVDRERVGVQGYFAEATGCLPYKAVDSAG
jgi:predicted N-acyltransferase